MKLLSTLKNIILFESSHKKPTGTVIFSRLMDNKLIQLKSTFHQRKERFGSDSYEDIVEKYRDFIETRKSKFQQEPRLAVPDSMIKNLFSENIENIYKSFEKEKPENDRLIFVHKRKDNEDEKKFDYIEILLTKDGNNFYVVTSAFSKDGDFLKTKNEEKKSRRVTVEQTIKSNYKVIYL
jgi:hypothetical protein